MRYSVLILASLPSYACSSLPPSEPERQPSPAISREMQPMERLADGSEKERPPRSGEMSTSTVPDVLSPRELQETPAKTVPEVLSPGDLRETPAKFLNLFWFFGGR
jgi:hypothetical protein